MNIAFTPALTHAEATHYYHLRDSVVFPIAEYTDRYPGHDAVLPMVLSVEGVLPTPPRPCDYQDVLDAVFHDGPAIEVRDLLRAGRKIDGIKRLRTYMMGAGWERPTLKHAKEACEQWLDYA